LGRKIPLFSSPAARSAIFPRPSAVSEGWFFRTLCWARNKDFSFFKDLTKFYNQFAFWFQPKRKLSETDFGPKPTRRQATIPDSPAKPDEKPKPVNFGD